MSKFVVQNLVPRHLGLAVRFCSGGCKKSSSRGCGGGDKSKSKNTCGRKGGSKNKDLKTILAEMIPKEQEIIKKFRKEHGNTKVDEVTVNKVYGGMRGMKGLICETSVLDPQEGIRFRGLSIPECVEQLPKAADCGEQPLPEAIFWLLLTGEVPSAEQCQAISKEWAERSCLPDHVEQFLDSVSPDVHPMSQFAAAITICNTESRFMEAVQKTKVKKSEYWDSTYEDAMDICAKITPMAAKIYRNTFKDRKTPPLDPSKDWSENFANMMGYDCWEFNELMRLYLTLHCDHEGGNVSAHTTHLVGSALSDPYLSFASGMNGLAGPLHGLANQEVLAFLEEQQKEVGDNPTEDKVKAFVEKTVKKTVIPGYGHAVLRKTDPRFVYFKKFADKFFPDDPLVKLVDVNFKVIPPVLKALGKVQNPWPNVDAGSGVLLQHYGMNEKTFYTVLFGVSRALGVLTSLVWDRALGFPIERPKSISTKAFIKLVKSQGKGGKGKGGSPCKKS